MIVAITGTGVAFTRLIDALAEVARSCPDEEIWVQAGSAVIPAALDGAPYVARDEILRRLGECDVVVCHGGTGTLHDVLGCGHVPVVVPRRKRLREHVNDHQLEVVEELARQGRIVALQDMGRLADAIAEARGRRASLPRVEGAAQLRNALRRASEQLRGSPELLRKVGWRLIRVATLCVPIDVGER